MTRGAGSSDPRSRGSDRPPAPGRARVGGRDLEPPPFWPRRGTYTIAGRAEPVLVLGLEPDGEIRILDHEGDIRRVAEFRVRIVDGLTAWP
jgi:hypothetical protein